MVKWMAVFFCSLLKKNLHSLSKREIYFGWIIQQQGKRRKKMQSNNNRLDPIWFRQTKINDWSKWKLKELHFDLTACHLYFLQLNSGIMISFVINWNDIYTYTFANNILTQFNYNIRQTNRERDRESVMKRKTKRRRRESECYFYSSFSFSFILIYRYTPVWCGWLFSFLFLFEEFFSHTLLSKFKKKKEPEEE